MPLSSTVKLVVFVPCTHADDVRAALAAANAGTQGLYDSCSFSSKGIGRFRPLEGANPSHGSIGSLESVEEERIEVIVQRDRLADALQRMKEVHPYEEVSYDVFSREEY